MNTHKHELISFIAGLLLGGLMTGAAAIGWASFALAEQEQR